MTKRSSPNAFRLISNCYGSLLPSLIRFILLLSFIFFLDATTMYFLRYSVVNESYFTSLCLESSVLTVTLLPVLYLLVFKPLMKQVKASILSEISTRESLELLNGVFASINEAVFIVITETRVITDLNQAAEKMFGYTREEILGKKTSILHLDYEMYLKFGEMIATSNDHFETSYRMKRKDGSTFPTEHSVSPLFVEKGSNKSYVCVIRDISEQFNREAELRSLALELETRNRFVESVISNLESGIIVVDCNYRIKLINKYVTEFSAKLPDVLLDRDLSDVCPELHSTLVSGTFCGEIPVTLFNKRRVIGFARFDLEGVYNISGGHIINFKDLTEIMKIRRELRHRERLSAVGEVVASVSHEMRNPLFAISSVAQILAMELSLNPAQKELMESLLKESRRINDLVEELLDSTREIRLQREIVDLNGIIKESFLVLKSVSQDKKVLLRNTTFAENVLVHADSEKLEQVVINLVKNAMEASPEGSHVDLSLEEGVGEVVISVTDHGEGIAKESIEKIFNVFYTTKKHGTGLGLSICKNIIEAHGGTLTACNNPEIGATFTMTLPFAGEN